MADVDLVGETDAEVWTDYWLEIIYSNPHIPTDRSTMIGWFANAIEAGREAGRREAERKSHASEG